MDSEKFVKTMEQNPLLGTFIAFAFGLGTCLTPCVYPMIAITVSVFGARKAKSRTEGALLSLAFVLGIAALFTPLGIISALTGSKMGEANSNPFVMVPLSLLFLAMAAFEELTDSQAPQPWPTV
jgi:thiol:disulfide interchange protein DsbD